MTRRAAAARRTVLGLAVAALGRRAARAQPVEGFRPAGIIVPAPAGSSPDVGARLLAEGLARRRGHTLVVENRPGADGVLGAEAFARARPGEALFYTFSGLVTTAPITAERPLPYDTNADLVPIHAAATDFLGLVVAAGSPVRSVAELVELARARPGALNWRGTAGTSVYLTFRDFMRRAGGLDMTYVSYRGTPPALLDLAAGRLDVVDASLAGALPLVRDGRLRLLAVTNPTRSPAAPEVPTAAEAGFPALENEGIHGLFGWRGMPGALRAELAAQAWETMTEPAAVERLRAAGMEPRGASSPAAFAAVLVAGRARWAALAREYGARPPG